MVGDAREIPNIFPACPVWQMQRKCREPHVLFVGMFATSHKLKRSLLLAFLSSAEQILAHGRTHSTHCEYYKLEMRSSRASLFSENPSLCVRFPCLQHRKLLRRFFWAAFGKCGGIAYLAGANWSLFLCFFFFAIIVLFSHFYISPQLSLLSISCAVGEELVACDGARLSKQPPFHEQQGWAYTYPALLR